MPARMKKNVVGWLAVLLVASQSFANHGPGTSDGGSATSSGETLKAGQFDLSLREDYTNFEDINRAKAEKEAMLHGGFDALQEGYITSVSLAYGILDDLQVSGQIG